MSAGTHLASATLKRLKRRRCSFKKIRVRERKKQSLRSEKSKLQQCWSVAVWTFSLFHYNVILQAPRWVPWVFLHSSLCLSCHLCWLQDIAFKRDTAQAKTLQKKKKKLQALETGWRGLGFNHCHCGGTWVLMMLANTGTPDAKHYFTVRDTGAEDFGTAYMSWEN